MRNLMMLAVLLVSCATTGVNYSGEEASCPSRMTEEQQRSGFVQCRAECASWGRDIVEFDGDCNCICTQPVRQGTPYAPPGKHSTPYPSSKTPTPGKVPNTQL